MLTFCRHGDILSTLRIISKKRIIQFWTKHPDAKQSLERWYKISKSNIFSGFKSVRESFGNADQTKVASGQNVVIFNISGNKYRLIASIHYNSEMIFVLRIMPHSEYDDNKWKDEL
jgi:mRNA interferase HigB